MKLKSSSKTQLRNTIMHTLAYRSLPRRSLVSIVSSQYDLSERTIATYINDLIRDGYIDRKGCTSTQCYNLTVTGYNIYIHTITQINLNSNRSSICL